MLRVLFFHTRKDSGQSHFYHPKCSHRQCRIDLPLIYYDIQSILEGICDHYESDLKHKDCMEN